MGDYVQKDMSGSLFKNDKGGNEARPDMKGTVLINGQAYWISAWSKVKGDKKWLSLSFQVKEDKPNVEVEVKKKSVDNDDNLPF